MNELYVKNKIILYCLSNTNVVHYNACRFSLLHTTILLTQTLCYGNIIFQYFSHLITQIYRNYFTKYRMKTNQRHSKQKIITKKLYIRHCFKTLSYYSNFSKYSSLYFMNTSYHSLVFSR